jgi:hypothetical protein
MTSTSWLPPENLPQQRITFLMHKSTFCGILYQINPGKPCRSETLY